MSRYKFLIVYSLISRLSYFPQIYKFLIKNGPAPEIHKRRFIKKILRRYQFLQSIETGTYLGHTTKILSRYVTNVFTIEISPRLSEFATNKFRKRNVTVIQGDSSEKLLHLVRKINTSCLFYLDGHVSGGITEGGQFVTPLKKELEILSLCECLDKSIIMIDDLLSLNGKNDYPDICEIRNFAEKYNLKIILTNVNMLLLMGSKVHLIKNK